MDDGIYFELFAVKNNVRYNAKIVSMYEAVRLLTEGMMSGVQKICDIPEGFDKIDASHE